MELNNIDWIFLNEWNVNNLVWDQYERNGMKSFYDNITSRLLF